LAARIVAHLSSSLHPQPWVLRGSQDKNMNSKNKAVYLLLVFGSILLLVAGWNLTEESASQLDRNSALTRSTGR